MAPWDDEIERLNRKIEELEDILKIYKCMCEDYKKLSLDRKQLNMDFELLMKDILSLSDKNLIKWKNYKRSMPDFPISLRSTSYTDG